MVSVIILSLSILNFSSCSLMKSLTESNSSPDHRLNIIFPSARELDEPDILDVYNGKGELIESFSTEGKYSYQIIYNELEFEEVCKIYSHKLDMTADFMTIRSYDDDARGAGTAGMTQSEIDNFDLKMDINYYKGTMEPGWYGGFEYKNWLNGGFEVKLNISNAELLRDKDLFFAVTPNYINEEDGEKTSCVFVATYSYENLDGEHSVYLPKGDEWEDMYIRLEIDDVEIFFETVSISAEKDCEFTVDFADYLP